MGFSMDVAAGRQDLLAISRASPWGRDHHRSAVRPPRRAWRPGIPNCRRSPPPGGMVVEDSTHRTPVIRRAILGGGVPGVRRPDGDAHLPRVAGELRGHLWNPRLLLRRRRRDHPHRLSGELRVYALQRLIVFNFDSPQPVRALEGFPLSSENHSVQAIADAVRPRFDAIRLAVRSTPAKLRIRPDERVLPDAGELMGGGESPRMACSPRPRAREAAQFAKTTPTDPAVVRDVAVGHEVTFVADHGSPDPHRAPMHGRNSRKTWRAPGRGGSSRRGISDPAAPSRGPRGERCGCLLRTPPGRPGARARQRAFRRRAGRGPRRPRRGRSRRRPREQRPKRRSRWDGPRGSRPVQESRSQHSLRA